MLQLEPFVYSTHFTFRLLQPRLDCRFFRESQSGVGRHATRLEARLPLSYSLICRQPTNQSTFKEAPIVAFPSPPPLSSVSYDPHSSSSLWFLFCVFGRTDRFGRPLEASIILVDEQVCCCRCLFFSFFPPCRLCIVVQCDQRCVVMERVPSCHYLFPSAPAQGRSDALGIVASHLQVPSAGQGVRMCSR